MPQGHIMRVSKSCLNNLTANNIMQVGIVGCGAIGSYLIRKIQKDHNLQLAFAYDLDKEKTKKVKAPTLFLPERADIVVEAAGQQAAKEIVPLALRHCNVLMLSVGAFADKKFERKARLLCKKHSHKVLVPSGAIAGLDAISAVRESLSSVTLTTTKNPRSLGRKDKKRTLVFSGTAREACIQLPKNVNVAATLSLAGIGFDRTKVMVYSDPSVERNTHEIAAKGGFGEMRTITSNAPSKENPKTSALAALSAFYTLQSQRPAVVVG